MAKRSALVGDVLLRRVWARRWGVGAGIAVGLGAVAACDGLLGIDELGPGPEDAAGGADAVADGGPTRGDGASGEGGTRRCSPTGRRMRWRAMGRMGR